MNKKYDVIVIGGSAAGIAAAITTRRHYPDKSILIIRDQKIVPIPCGIPYIFGTVKTPENNIIPDSVLDNNKIELIIDFVTDINNESHSITTKSETTITYEKLIIATGSNPIIPPIKGINLKNVFNINKHNDYLQNMLNTLNNVNDLVIIGGGFIGVEFADECKKKRDINVSIIELAPHCLNAVYDEETCKEVETQLRDSGINILSNEKAVEICGEQTVTSVKLSSNKELTADMVILGIGSTPNIKLAQSCNLEINQKTGGIVVDNRQQTSDPDIFACGDCTSKTSFFTGKVSHLMLASIATTEARIAGANLFKSIRGNNGVIGAFSTVIAGTAFAAAGLTEKQAKALGYNVVTGTAASPNRHPGKMPGMAKLKVKLIFNKEGLIILGGQIVGADSAGELINVIVACIQARMTADQIALFQTATHPALTASPISYQLVNAAEIAIMSAI